MDAYERVSGRRVMVKRWGWRKTASKKLLVYQPNADYTLLVNKAAAFQLFTDVVCCFQLQNRK